MICVWKKRTETLAELLVRVKIEQEISPEEKVTYAGRLDPMAEGLVVLLVGSEVYEKDRMIGLSKEYEVEILFGIGSDTDDVLGIYTLGSSIVLTRAVVKSHLAEFVGSREESYPSYSSKTVDGKPLWQWHRQGKIGQVTIPTHIETIDDIALLSLTTKKSSEVFKKIKNDVPKVIGDFRQEEILERLDTITFLLPRELTVAKIRVTVQSGTYMRTLARRVGEALGTKALALSITRTKVGDLVKEHCDMR
ncbi:MAG: tRNA pseudouridine55 synthase [Planctomycetota bacterium]|jgi:tRNA pseudouridine55 synthase